jgi:glutaminyl-tRNA synthetase
VDKDEEGNITAVHCTYDPETRGGNAPDGRKVRGTIHWVAAKTALSCEVRLFENIVDEEKGVYDDETGELNLNPNSLQILEDCKVEPSLKGAKAPESFQFVRTGFFCVDSKLNTEEKPVFNRIVSLKSSFKLPAAQ